MTGKNLHSYLPPKILLASDEYSPWSSSLKLAIPRITDSLGGVDKFEVLNRQASQAGIPCQIGEAAQIVVSVGNKVGRRRLLDRRQVAGGVFTSGQRFTGAPVR